jgi:HAD superfamily hydrolase (TIGR01509 family)
VGAVPGLLLDFDGLMVDTERCLAEALVEVVADYGATVSVADFGHLFGSTEVDEEWEALLLEWCGEAVSVPEMDARLDELFTPRADELPLLPGVAALLDGAREAGWGVALATGRRRALLDPMLERLGVDGAFDTIVTAEEVPRGKPAPDIFLAAAGRLDLPPAACTVLEDSVPGCDAALAAGMRVVVCPSVVSAHCDFPPEARRVASLCELSVPDLAEPSDPPGRLPGCASGWSPAG